MIDTITKIAANAQIGKGTIIEEFTVIAPNAKIGDECKIHRNIFIDSNVIIGNRVKIQDNVMIPHGVTLEDGVFVGPSASFTNDKYPRSINPDGTNHPKIGTSARLWLNMALLSEPTLQFCVG